MTGGEFTDITEFDPYIQSIIFEDSGEVPVEGQFNLDRWYPLTVASVNRTVEIPALFAQNIVVVPGQFYATTTGSNPTRGIQRLYNSLDLTVFELPAGATTDFIEPSIWQIGATTGFGGDVTFKVLVTDETQSEPVTDSGIYRTVVLYRNLNSTVWEMVDLTYNATTQTAEGTITPTMGGVHEYFVQVVDGAGNVALGLDHNNYYRFTVSSGPGTFEPGGSSDISLGDINDDGLPDVVLANPNGSSGVYFFDGGGFVSAGAEYDFTPSTTVTTGDIDGDGDIDVVAVIVGTPTRAYVYENTGTGLVLIDQFGSLSSSASSGRVGLALGDIDNDGDLDAVMPNQKSAASQADAYDIFMNDGTGNFEPLTTGGGKLDPDDGKAVALGYINGDQYLDIVVAVNGGGNKLYLSNGVNGANLFLGFTLHTSFGGGKGFPQDIAVADLNDDGRDDIVVAVSGKGKNGSEQVFMNIGSGLFLPSNPTSTFSNGGDSTAVELGDADNDGDIDAYIANRGNVNWLYLNNGSGIFSTLKQAFEPADSTALALVDLTLDGYLDVIVTNDGSANTTWLNTGDGGLVQAQ